MAIYLIMLNSLLMYVVDNGICIRLCYCTSPLVLNPINEIIELPVQYVFKSPSKNLQGKDKTFKFSKNFYLPTRDSHLLIETSIEV